MFLNKGRRKKRLFIALSTESKGMGLAADDKVEQNFRP
jgi:hypothetical protein